MIFYTFFALANLKNFTVMAVCVTDWYHATNLEGERENERERDLGSGAHRY